MEYYAVCDKAYSVWLSVYDTKEHAIAASKINPEDITLESDMPAGWIGDIDAEFLEVSLEPKQVYKITIDKI